MKNIKKLLALLLIITLCLFTAMACDEDEPAATTTADIIPETPGESNDTTSSPAPESTSEDITAGSPESSAEETTAGKVTTTEAPPETTAPVHTHTPIIDAAIEPTCTTAGKTEGKHCSECNNVIVAQKEIAAIGHSADNNGKCIRCGITLFSAGLEYKLQNDGTSYSVVGIGTCTDTDIAIPSKYNNLPVIHINDKAFVLNSSLTSVILPDSITSIGSNAFGICPSIKSITFIGNSKLTEWIG